jgi:hypothetical protein
MQPIQKNPPDLDLMKLRIAIEKTHYHQQLAETALGLAFTSGGGELGDYYLVETIRRMDDLNEAIDTIKELTATVVDKEFPNHGYYVTLCVVTETSTRAISWHLNAKFKTLESAQEYKSSLSEELYHINSTTPILKDDDYIEGKRIIAITKNGGPNLVYEEYHF